MAQQARYIANAVSLPCISDADTGYGDVLNVANGLLDWRAGTLTEHSPGFVSTTEIPVAWDPDATCPAICPQVGKSDPAELGRGSAKSLQIARI